MTSDSDEYQLAPEQPRGGVPLQPSAARPDNRPPAAGEPVGFVRERLKSLDVYRGLIMISLAFGGFGLAATAENYLSQDPGDEFWQQVHYQFSHAEWVGCSYWDLIQPSFMFMVGVSMAFSYAKRARLGHSYSRMFFHAVWRSLVLILLGIFLTSNWQNSTNWSLMNVLCQIGLGYTFVFLMWNRPRILQFVVAVVVLLAVWAGYTFYPQLNSIGRQPQPVLAERGVSEAWVERYEDPELVGEAWEKNDNLGSAIDRWLLNLFPREEPFRFNRGGYQTINFVPSIVTMLFGLMCGELLRSQHRGKAYKLIMLVLAGIAGLALGWFLHSAGICPLVKRLWTPSWTLFSTGWCCLILATIYFLVDMLPLGPLAFPVAVVGVNSLAIYCMSMLLKPWVARSLKTHFGEQVFRLRTTWEGDLYRLWFVDDGMETTIVMMQPTIQAVFVGLCFWLVCFWMYRQRIFVRI